jgi:hypothetical protein
MLLPSQPAAEELVVFTREVADLILRQIASRIKTPKRLKETETEGVS